MEINGNKNDDKMINQKIKIFSLRNNTFYLYSTKINGQ